MPEAAFAAHPPPMALARLGTVTRDGDPHVVPVGWSWDGDRGLFRLGGRNVLETQRARHVRDRGRATISIDGVATDNGWSPWALLVTGRAELDEEADEILLHPDAVTSWGLEQLSPPVEGSASRR